MPEARRKPDTKSIDDVAQLLSQIVDVGSSPHQAAELTGEMSELLWAITDLDPDGEQLLKHSGYVADIVSQSSD